MKLVVDTNIVFSLFKKESFTRELIKKHSFELFAPDCLDKELDKYAEEICSKGKVSIESYREVKKLVLDIISIEHLSKEDLSKAEPLISHKSDTPFLALALKLKMPLWTNDKHFKEQSLVRLYDTHKLSKLFDK